MKTEDALLILLDWRQGEDTATISELYRELSAANVHVDLVTVHRNVQRLRDTGHITCTGHAQNDGVHLARIYRLTRSGRNAARMRKEIMQVLLDTPPQDLLAEEAS
jgi:hypothetical protein